MPNFGTGFSSVSSDIMLHLAQWQYWWWFWFAFLWSFYFFVMSRAVRLSVLKLSPRINTSQSSHGKWGDFLACVVPTVWCINMLTNSSFILSLMEWQNESTLFTMSVRGSQWYWVYKFELSHMVDMLNAPKNMGNNQWVVNTGGSLEATDSYLYALSASHQNAWLKSYWDSYLKSVASLSRQASVGSADTLPSSWAGESSFLNSTLGVTPLEEAASLVFESGLGKSSSYSGPESGWLYSPQKTSLSPYPSLSKDSDFLSWKSPTLGYASSPVTSLSSLEGRLLDTDGRGLVNYSASSLESIDVSSFSKSSVSDYSPLLLSKSLLSLDKSSDLSSGTEGVVSMYANKESSLVHSLQNDQSFLVLKQKSYKSKKVMPESAQYFKSEAFLKLSKVKFSDSPSFVASNFIDSTELSPTSSYSLLKKNSVRDESMPVSLSSSLLRTKKTLVIPAHVNLTLMTNSYDVMHSWFMPSLGMKMDCVPGSSTHHTFYCDNVGFFYGMCAEVCGSYHHHMPMSVCALPFEHFLIWWHHFGVNKVLSSMAKKSYESKYSGKTFAW